MEPPPMTAAETGEHMIECPYNKSHLISAARMQFHLVKCRKASYLQASGEDTKTCPFNGQHHVKSLDFHNHMATCPDKSTVVRFVTNPGEQGSVIPAYVAPKLPNDEENWDDGNAATYDPNEKLQNAVVLRVLMGATKSQRKSFRKNERERINHLLNGPLESTDPAPGYHPDEPQAQPVLKIEQKECFETSKSLRAPKKRSETFVLPHDLMHKVGQGRGKAPAMAVSNGMVNRTCMPTIYDEPIDEINPNSPPFKLKSKKNKKKANAVPSAVEVRPSVPVPKGPVMHPRTSGSKAFNAAFSARAASPPGSSGLAASPPGSSGLAASPPGSSGLAASPPGSLGFAASIGANGFAAVSVNSGAYSVAANEDVWNGLPLSTTVYDEIDSISGPNFLHDFPVLMHGRGRGRQLEKNKKK